MSLFITFEGGEGCGKSTQSRRLYRRLLQQGIPALLVHEPGVTALGKKIRRLLKWSEELNIAPVAELLLFNTARAQLVMEVIKPALEKGTLVVCDRFADSTTAYQGYGRGLDLKIVEAANKIGVMGLQPDLTILMDIPVATGLARKKPGESDRFEKETQGFHRRVRRGYLKMAEAEKTRWFVIDATKDKHQIAGIIWERVIHLIKKKQGV
jgi:dTMP kinase